METKIPVTSNMPCSMESLNWSEEDIKKIEERQALYVSLLDKYGLDALYNATMELINNGEIKPEDDLEDYKDILINKIENSQNNNN